MAILTTLADLRQRFYDRFDEGQSLYIDVAQANRLINEAGAHLHNWISTADEWYLWKRYTVLPQANVMDYPLPSDFHKSLKVFGTYANPTPGQAAYYWPLARIMPEEFRGGPASAFRLPFQQPYGYMILGNTLRLTPVPQVQQNYAVEMWYAPHYTPLVNDTDVMDISVAPGWDEFVVDYAVISAKIKEESVVADINGRMAEIKQMITDDMVNRDMGRPQHVVDVGGGYFGGTWGGWGPLV